VRIRTGESRHRKYRQDLLRAAHASGTSYLTVNFGDIALDDGLDRPTADEIEIQMILVLDLSYFHMSGETDRRLKKAGWRRIPSVLHVS